jgi:hypothetical protein
MSVKAMGRVFRKCSQASSRRNTFSREFSLRTRDGREMVRGTDGFNRGRLIYVDGRAARIVSPPHFEARV